DDGFDAVGDLPGRMTRDIIRADHDDRRFGIEVVEFVAVGDPPKDVAGLIAADAEVHRLEGAEILLPSVLTFPRVRDRIAEEDDVARALALLDPSEELFVPWDVTIEFLRGGIVRGLIVPDQSGSREAECQHTANGDEADHDALGNDRASI